MQFHICKTKHILYTHEETAFPCPGWAQNYCFEEVIQLRQMQFHISNIKHKWYTHEETTLPYPWKTQNHLIRQLYGGSKLREANAIQLLNCNKCNFMFIKLNTFCTRMKRQHFLALGGHRITILGQLFWRSLHETKVI